MFVIYKILFEDGDFYIGHTCNLNARIRSHRHSSKQEKFKDYPLYKKLKDEKHNYTVLESKECDKKEIFELENKYILELNPILNQRKAVFNVLLERDKNKERMRKKREGWTPEQHEAKKKYDRENAKKKKTIRAEKEKEKIKTMTKEENEERLRKKREYYKKNKKEKTPEQREIHNMRTREYYKKIREKKI